MIDISEPLGPGSKITFELSGERQTEAITEAFWEERPKGGKEFCFKTVSGLIVPLSCVISSEAARPVRDAIQLHHNTDEAATKDFDAEFMHAIIDSSRLSIFTKSVLHLVIDDDIETLGLAHAMLDHKLKSLRKFLSEGNPTGGNNG